MRYIFFLLLFTSSYTFGQSILEKHIDLDIHDSSVSAILEQLEDAAQVEIAYSSSFFQNRPSINLQAKAQPLAGILDEILADSNLTYKVSGNRIILYRKTQQQYTISGYVEEEGSGERLISAAVYCPALGLGIITNEYGFYSLSLPAGSHQIRCSYLGFQEKTMTIQLKDDQQQPIQLNKYNMLAEVVVTPDSLENPYFISKTEEYFQLSPDLLHLLPGLGGEDDPVRATHLLPGVQAGSDGLGGIQVRGSNNGHNLMLLDGVPVYIPYHLLGMLSIYNASTIQSTKLLTGNFSARYGGGLASILDVRTREGNQYEWHGEAGINMTNFQLLAEGPIKKEQSAVLLAFRQTHSTYLLSSVLGNAKLLPVDEGLNSNFFDLNAKWNYKFSLKDRIYLSHYTSGDLMYSEFYEDDNDFTTEIETEVAWANTITSFRWNHLFNDKLFANLTLTRSRSSFNYSIFLEETENDDDSREELFFYNAESETADNGIRLDFDFHPNSRHQIRFGGGITKRSFAPGIHAFDELSEEIEEEDPEDLDFFDNLTITQNFDAQELFLYAEDQIKLNKYLQLQLGLRNSAFLFDDAEYLEWEPRFELTAKLSPKINWSLGGSRMVQYLHLISSSSLQLPTDLWIPSNEQLSPQKALLAETYLKVQPNAQTIISLGLYYRQLQNLYRLPDLIPAADIVTEELEELLLQGEGQSRGVELFIDHHQDRYGFLASYTLSKADRQFALLNDALRFPYSFDARHQLKLLYYRLIGKHFQWSINWFYQSPHPRLHLASSESADVFLTISPEEDGQKNQSRSIAYHRLDSSLSYQLKHASLEHKLKLSVNNLYNRQNVAFYEVNADHSNFTSSPITALPFLPSVSYRLNF